MWRCSQPCTGILGSRSKYDEAFIRLLGHCNSSIVNKSGSVEIFDARPILNARANKVSGGGFEDCGSNSNYNNCRLVFLDIENIHVVRSSYGKQYEMAYTQNPPTEKLTNNSHFT